MPGDELQPLPVSGIRRILRGIVSGGARDVGPGKIIALEKQGFPGCLGQRIGERVADVQAGGVAAATEAAESLAGDPCLISGDRSDLDPGLA
jgi:hypothetical protein